MSNRGEIVSIHRGRVLDEGHDFYHKDSNGNRHKRYGKITFEIDNGEIIEVSREKVPFYIGEGNYVYCALVKKKMQPEPEWHISRTYPGRVE